MNTPDHQEAAQYTSQNLFLFFITLVIHVVIAAREFLVGWSNPIYIGYMTLGFILGSLFGVLQLSEQFAIHVSKRLEDTIGLWLSRFPIERIRRIDRIYWLSSIGFILTGIVLRIFVIFSVPVAVSVADMLPLILKASNALLAGQYPYQVYHFPYAMPLTFLPGLWLPFLPLVALDLDPRWAGLLIWLLISLLLVKLYHDTAISRQSPAPLLIGTLNLALLQFSPILFQFHAFGHTFPLWLWLSILCIGVICKRNFLIAVGLGLVLASRQTSLVYIPIFLYDWYRRHGIKRTIHYSMVAAGVFGLLTLPFAIYAPAQVFLAPIQHYQALAARDLARGLDSFMANSIGFSYLIQDRLGRQALANLNVLMIFISAALSPYLTGHRKRMLVGMAAIFTWFNLFTPIPWTYIYFDELIILAFAMVL